MKKILHIYFFSLFSLVSSYGNVFFPFEAEDIKNTEVILKNCGNIKLRILT